MDLLPAINGSKIAWALAGILLNLGARSIPTTLSPESQKLLASPAMMRVVVFSLFFATTRDAMVAVALTVGFFVVTSTVLDERSRFNLVHRTQDRQGRAHPPTPSAAADSARAPAAAVTREMYDAAVNVVLRFRKQGRRPLAAPPLNGPAATPSTAT